MRMAMTDDEFTKLFKYIQEMRSGMQDGFAALYKEFDKIHNDIDHLAKMSATDKIERLALNKQVDRHEDWINRAAPAVNVRYTAHG